MNNKYEIMAGIGIGFSIVLFLTTAIFMAIAKDLTQKSISQGYYIKELEWELSQVEQMICSEVENE